MQGGQPGTEHEGVIYGDYVREVDASGTTVWEWHAQDELDIERYPLNPMVHRDEFAHANACCPLPNGDVMLSFRRLSTIMIIDRNTRKPRWEQRDDAWGMQHDCEDAGQRAYHLVRQRTEHGTESVLAGDRARSRHASDGVGGIQGNPPWTFFSPHISGAQRLASGNTLICEGQWGRVFEVAPEGEIVWEYINPHHVSSGQASLLTGSSAPTATLPIRQKSAGAWARSVPETGAAIYGGAPRRRRRRAERWRSVLSHKPKGHKMERFL